MNETVDPKQVSWPDNLGICCQASTKVADVVDIVSNVVKVTVVEVTVVEGNSVVVAEITPAALWRLT
jgi:hypothetical protein